MTPDRAAASPHDSFRAEEPHQVFAPVCGAKPAGVGDHEAAHHRVNAEGKDHRPDARIGTPQVH